MISGVSDVLAAARRLHGLARQTPLQAAPALSRLAGREVVLKLENQQRTGSFKLRGALNALACRPRARLERGVVTASAGNHGLGVALGASLLGVRATVFVPEHAAETKCSRIAGLGAELRRVAGGYDDAHAAAQSFAVSERVDYIHAFSDDTVVAGQGTVGLEIVLERPDVRIVLVPVGGGGLIGGIGVVAHALAPGARVVGVQSERTCAMHDSLAAGRLVSPPVLPTLCDGLAGDTDEQSFSLARQVVDEVVLVSEAAIRRAIAFLLSQEGMLVEPSAAVVAALLLEGHPSIEAGPIVAVLSGGNIDAVVLSEILRTTPAK